MIEVSTRYLGAALAMVLLALVPVGVHSFGGHDHEDCADPQAMMDLGAVEGTFDVDERSEQMRRPWLQWTHARVEPTSYGVEPLDARVLRSTRPRRIYMRPTSFLKRKVETDEVGVRWIESDGERLPIHTARVFLHGEDVMEVMSWLYVYGGRPVEHPFREQLASAVPQLVGGTRPLTLFLISGRAPRQRLERVTDPSDEWLRAAWRRYASVCAE